MKTLRLLACLAFVPLLHANSQPTFDPTEFNKNAAQYGNKSANLIELKHIAHYLRDNQKLNVSIPDIFPLSHAEITSYLQATLGDFVQKAWSDFKAQQPTNEKALTDGARRVLAGIRNDIHEAFRAPIALTAERLDQLSKFFSAHKSSLLMVRSTGKEDTATLANAGGNESIPSVKPSLAAVSTAIGQVIASYFSEKSLGQRLKANDATIFDDPFMPILIQVMIGESANNKDEKKIPVSGVIFSQEAEGHTPGVVQIQATYGHGEAVVNGLVPVDTFYIGLSDIIHPVIRIKKDRLATMRDNSHFKLGYQTNPNGLSTRQCLSNALVLALKQTAQEVQRYYENHPMDIEFVVQGDAIYLVQARPIVEQKIQASFLSKEFVQSLAPENILRVDVIGVGGGAVREITAKDQMIVNDNIRDALTRFLDSKDEDLIQCVAVSQMAPATSHEATTFRGANKPVLRLKDLGPLLQWLEAPRLVVDAQRGIIVRLMAGQKPAITQGWYSHPIPALLSLMPDNIQKLTQEQLAPLKPQDFFKGKLIRELVEDVKNASLDQAIKALRSILARTWAAVQEEEKKLAVMKKVTDTDRTLIRQLKAVYAHLITSAHEINTVLALPSAARLQRLYPITFLEALISQWPQPFEIINNYSLGALIKIEEEERAIKKELPTLTPYAVQFAKITPFALTDAVAKDWKSFIAGIAPNDQPKLAALIKDLIVLDLAPLWINTSFAFAWEKTKGNAQETVTKLLAEQAQIKDFFQQLQDHKKRINDLVIPQWEDPGKFKSQVKQLDGILEFFKSDAFKATYESTSDLGKNAALVVMMSLVDRFDTSIKTLEASQKYKVDQKVENFEKMLQQYLGLLSAWTTLPTIKNIFRALHDYIADVSDLLTKASREPRTLRPSGKVNVAGAALGSHASFGRSLGEYNTPTLEDTFSIIHQSLLNLLSSLASKTNLIEMDVPESVKAIQAILAKPFGSRGEFIIQPVLVGISLDKENLSYRYNIPLDEHSGTIKLQWSKGGAVYLFVEFIGKALDRWPFIYFVAQLSQQGGFSFVQGQEPHLDPNRGSVTFAWAFDSEQAIRRLPIFNFLVFLTQTTFGFNPEEALYSLRPLFPKDKNFDQALLKTTDMFLKTPHSDFFSMLIRIFSPVIDKGHSDFYPAALTFASIAIKSLSEKLKKRGYYEDVHADTLFQVQNRAFELLKLLVEKDYGFDRAIAIASEESRFPYHATKKQVLDIFGALVKKGRGFREAIDAAQQNINNKDAMVRLYASILFKRLFKEKQGFKEAFATAQQNINSPDMGIRESALDIFAALIEEGQGLTEGFAAAQQNINSADKYSRAGALRVFNALVRKGQAFKEAFAATQQNINDSYGRSLVLTLFESLVEKGQAFEEAINAAQQNIFARNPEHALSLFKALIKQGQGISSAASVIATAIKKDYVRLSIKELFEALNSSSHPDAKKAIAQLKIDLKDVEPANEQAIRLRDEVIGSSHP